MPRPHIAVAALSPLLLFGAASQAQVLTSRTALEAVLTDQIEIEDFEFISLHAGGTLTTPNPLNDAAALTWGVVPIPTYSSEGELQLHATFFAGEETVRLRATEGMRIEFDPPQSAVGFQLFGASTTVRYFLHDTELGSHTLDSGFSGFDATDTGLTALTITSESASTTAAIDDLAFGLDFVCRADLFEDGILNFFDLGEFLSLFNDKDELADFAPPIGVYNFFDLGAFLEALNTGCP